MPLLTIAAMEMAGLFNSYFISGASTAQILLWRPFALVGNMHWRNKKMTLSNVLQMVAG